MEANNVRFTLMDYNNGLFAITDLKTEKDYGCFTNEHKLYSIIDLLNSLNDKNKDYIEIIKKLDKEIWGEHLRVQSIIFKYASQFKRDSVEFNFMMNMAEDLGCTISLMEAIDDE